LPPIQEAEDPAEVIPIVEGWVRRALLGMAVFLTAIFGIAAWLNPYDETGQPRRMETHLQLGLPPCTFRLMTGVPCPSCGMTTSFSLLMHGDPWDSLRANAVGTLLAIFCLALIPWSVACVICRRLFFIVALDRALTWTIIIFMSLVLVRWGIVLGWHWWTGTKF
jgi:hypothetical protein